MSSNIFLSRLSAYIDERIGDHRRGFRRNRSSTDQIKGMGLSSLQQLLKYNTDQIFCIQHLLEKKWVYNETVHKLFIEFGVPMKLVRLINMCLNET
jgi:hypothetical protein